MCSWVLTMAFATTKNVFSHPCLLTGNVSGWTPPKHLSFHNVNEGNDPTSTGWQVPTKGGCLGEVMSYFRRVSQPFDDKGFGLSSPQAVLTQQFNEVLSHLEVSTFRGVVGSPIHGSELHRRSTLVNIYVLFE